MRKTSNERLDRDDERPPMTRWAGAWVLAAVVIPIVAFGVPDDIRIPKVAEREKGDPPSSAMFSHWSHSAYQCSSCHPGTFPQHKQGFTHDDMEEGRYCGSCHDGKTVWSPKSPGIDCETCHVPEGETIPDDEDIFDFDKAQTWMQAR